MGSTPNFHMHICCKLYILYIWPYISAVAINVNLKSTRKISLPVVFEINGKGARSLTEKLCWNKISVLFGNFLLICLCNTFSNAIFANSSIFIPLPFALLPKMFKPNSTITLFHTNLNFDHSQFWRNFLLQSYQHMFLFMIFTIHLTSISGFFNFYLLSLNFDKGPQ